MINFITQYFLACRDLEST